MFLLFTNKPTGQIVHFFATFFRNNRLLNNRLESFSCPFFRRNGVGFRPRRAGFVSFIIFYYAVMETGPNAPLGGGKREV
jgi:hypothetical protein